MLIDRRNRIKRKHNRNIVNFVIQNFVEVHTPGSLFRDGIYKICCYKTFLIWWEFLHGEPCCHSDISVCILNVCFVEIFCWKMSLIKRCVYPVPHGNARGVIRGGPVSDSRRKNRNEANLKLRHALRAGGVTTKL